jgi:hypothetical protein
MQARQQLQQMRTLPPGSGPPGQPGQMGDPQRPGVYL